MIVITLLAVVLSLLLVGLKKLHNKYTYFEKRGIKHMKPMLLFGNSWEIFTGKKHPGEIIEKAYRMFPNEDIVGHYDFTKASIILRNPELIEKILIKDFSHFVDRFQTLGPIKNPGDASLLILSGNTWRATRYKFAPLFTSGKLKYMYNSIKDCGKTLIKVMDKNDGKEVELNEITVHFAMDVIGSCAFGIDTNVLENPDSEFRQKGKRIFTTTFLDNVRFVIMIFLPKLAKFLGLENFFNKESMEYYENIISNTMEYRKREGKERNDFVQMLLQLKEKGKVEIQLHDTHDDYLMIDKPPETFELELNDNILLGGAITFLTAGFHASAMTLAYCIYELSQKPHVIKRIRDEVKKCSNSEDITYDELKSMTYLENVIKETLRIHPSLAILTRVCTKDYTLPNGYVIKQGTDVLMPVSALQMDPQYFPDPYDFNPDRFLEPPVPGTYLPFGDGPRVCIAMRFAIVEMKFALAKLLSNYEFILSENNAVPLKRSPRAFVTTPKDPIRFHVKRIAAS